MTIVSISDSDLNQTVSYEIKYGNDVVDIMFDDSGKETLNPCECTEYINDYQQMVKVCFRKQFHVVFM